MMPATSVQRPLQGLRVLIVEDEWLIAAHLKDLLTDMGCQIAGHASHQRQALDVASKAEFDIALLDINLAGSDVFPVAKAITERRLPFAFVTGYGAGHNMGPYGDRPVLQKPITALGLGNVLKKALEADGAKP
ncbi:MAG: response regulator [Alphaproteobacteria bacterium]|nr:response regulator [Alphaproteobacteria bacterium]